MDSTPSDSKVYALRLVRCGVVLTAGGRGILGEGVAPVREESQAIPNGSIPVQTVQNAVPGLRRRNVRSVRIDLMNEVLRMNNGRETAMGCLEVPKPCLGQGESAEGTNEGW